MGTIMKKIKWGIISTGRITHQFASDFQFTKNGELAAVASRKIGTAQKFAEQYNIPKTYSSYNELIEDTEIDAVYIATPHNYHYQNTIDSLNNGKAVLCEKPLTLNPEECKGLIEKSKETNTYLMEAMWTYFLPALQKALQWVNEGRIGKILHVKADFGYPQKYDAKKREYDAKLGGGCLLEMGIYPIAIAWFFMQKDPAEIKVLTRKAPNGVEDDLNILFNYDDSVATLGTSFRCKLRNWAYIIGEQGYIAIPDFWRTRKCYLYELDEIKDYFEDRRKGFGFEFETEAVNNDLLNNKKENDVMPLNFSLKFQEHMKRIKQLS